jgi:hypothetical protein
MKTYFQSIVSFLLLGSSILTSSTKVLAQGATDTKVSTCTNSTINSSLVSANKASEKKGYTLTTFQIVDLPSKTYLPIALNTVSGAQYEINFVTHSKNKEYTVAVIDENRKEVMKTHKKIKAVGDEIMNATFKPTKPGNYWIVLSQKVNNNESCSGISILKK